MGFLLDRTYPASFKGAEFYFISNEMTSGRKTIVNEYPNKDNRKIEDLGLSLRTFTVNAKITGFFYEDNKSALEKVLNSKGAGIFVHPFLGNINCVCTTWTVSEKIASVNVALYTITFYEVKDTAAPRPDGSNIAVIANLYRDIYDFIKNDLNGQYIARFAKNISYTGQKLTQLADTLRGLRGTVGAVTQSGSEFVNQIINFNENVYRIASPGGDIGGHTSDIIQSFDSLSDDGQTRFNASSGLIGIGSTDSFTTLDTVSASERNNNLKLINGTINTLAFTNLVDAAKKINYEDEDQLNTIVDTINSKYDELINSDYNKFSTDLRDKIAEIRNQSRVFFENVRVTVNKIVEVETNQTPVAVLAYNYYGNTDDYNYLLKLNNNFNPSVISGTVKILEA